MGGPSAAIVLTELIALGARRAVRVGTCGALAAGIELGELVVAREAICADGTSRALGAGERVGADEQLTQALLAHCAPARAGTIVSVDLFYENGRPGAGHEAARRRDGGRRAVRRRPLRRRCRGLRARGLRHVRRGW